MPNIDAVALIKIIIRVLVIVFIVGTVVTAISVFAAGRADSLGVLFNGGVVLSGAEAFRWLLSAFSTEFNIGSLLFTAGASVVALELGFLLWRFISRVLS